MDEIVKTVEMMLAHYLAQYTLKKISKEDYIEMLDTMSASFETVLNMMRDEKERFIKAECSATVKDGE